VHTRLVVMQVYIEKMFTKNIESVVFHLCQRALVPSLRNDRDPNATASIALGKTSKELLITLVFSILTFNFNFYSML